MRPNKIYVDGSYANRNPQYHVEDSPWKAQQILKMLDRNNLVLGTICEIGCGAGEILHQLQLNLPNNVNFYGYDISPQAYALCKYRENTRLHFFNEELPDNSIHNIDLLLCMDVVEHIEDYLGFLRKLRNKANYKIFHLPIDMTVQMVLRNKPIIRVREVVGHLHYFSKDTALLSLKDAGYKILDWFYTPSGIDRPKGVKMNLARLPRSIFYRISKDLSVRILGGYSILILSK